MSNSLSYLLVFLLCLKARKNMSQLGKVVFNQLYDIDKGTR